MKNNQLRQCSISSSSNALLMNNIPVRMATVKTLMQADADEDVSKRN